MKIYYISDLHLFHENVIGLEDRPYENVSEMHEDIISKWNSVVKKDDVVRILGDVAFPKNQEDINETIKIIKKLNGNKSLVIGNHDHKLLKNQNFLSLFANVDHYMRTKDEGRLVILSHYPMEEWDGYFRNSYHLFGHVHNKDTNLKVLPRRFNVCADVIGFTPRTLDELIEMNANKYT